MKALIALISIPLILLLGSLLRGWVFSKLWLWFIVASFHVAPLGVAACIGIALTVAFITHQHIHTEDRRSPKDKLFEGFGAAFIGPFLILGFAKLVSLYL